MQNLLNNLRGNVEERASADIDNAGPVPESGVPSANFCEIGPAAGQANGLVVTVSDSTLVSAQDKTHCDDEDALPTQLTTDMVPGGPLLMTAVVVEDATPSLVPSLVRRTSQYSPPLAKAIRIVKRSELKRHLKGQLGSSAAIGGTSSQVAVDSSPQPQATLDRTMSGSRHSRGSRLLNLASRSSHRARPVCVPLGTIPPSSGLQEAQTITDMQYHTECLQLLSEIDLKADVHEEGRSLPMATTPMDLNSSQKEAGAAGALDRTLVPLHPDNADVIKMPRLTVAGADTFSSAAADEVVVPVVVDVIEEPAEVNEIDTKIYVPETTAADKDPEVLLLPEELQREGTPIPDHGPGSRFMPLPSLMPSNLSGEEESPSLSYMVCAGMLNGLAGGAQALNSNTIRAENALELVMLGGADGGGEEGVRRVRFAGMNSDGPNECENTREEEEAKHPAGDDASPLPVVPSAPGSNGQQRGPLLLPPRSSSSSHVIPVQPRFGIGAFVRGPTTGVGATSSTVMPDGTIVTAGYCDAESPPRDDTPDAPVVIARRMCGGGHFPTRRKSGMFFPGLIGNMSPQAGKGILPDESGVPQPLREAYLNSRLAECWRRGEAWARLDLSGVEFPLPALDDPGGNGNDMPNKHHEGRRNDSTSVVANLRAATAALVNQRGEKALESALDVLNAEWEHLKALRQRYVASPTGITSCRTAPRSILKRFSNLVEKPFVESRPQDATPPGIGTAVGGGLFSQLPGFEDILAADIITIGDDQRLGEDAVKEESSPPWLLHSQGNYTYSTPEITPALNVPGVARSRGEKMLASLQPGDGCNNQTAPDTAVTPRADGQAYRTRSRVLTGMEGKRRCYSAGPVGKHTRGQRLLKALQRAAGPSGATSTAAAAARLIVDGVVTTDANDFDADLNLRPMATAFVHM